jgi:hypothetical protein
LAEQNERDAAKKKSWFEKIWYRFDEENER